MTEDDPEQDSIEAAEAPVSPPGYSSLIVVGRGGAATVYSAAETTTGRRVALKIFDKSGESQCDRQVRSAERLGELDGVSPVLDHGSLPDGRRFLTTPYVASGSLSDRLDRFGPMVPSEVVDVGRTLATTLAGAHRLGVLHRDLKPSNVLVDDGDRPLLADFGASVIVDAATASETLPITVAYAAPEVLEGAAADERSDVYALGLTLLTLVTGSVPFRTDTGLASLVNDICSTGAPDPAGVGVPAGLASVIRTATAKDPNRRYPTATAMADALAEVQQHPDRAAPASLKATSSARRPRRALIGVAALAAIATAAAFALTGKDDTPAASQQEGPASTTAAPGGAATSTTTISTLGAPVTAASGILGPLYAQDDFAYAGKLTKECGPDDRRVAIAIHADDSDRAAGVAEPWVAVKGAEAGSFMAYMPCVSGGKNIRYVLRAPGRWFVTVNQFPQDQYDRMVQWMQENETSPAPDYTVDDPIRATLADPASYEGWSIVDRAK